MKLLIYGGCHAEAFKRILDKYALSAVEADIIKNYKLIGTRKPFPYESLRNYDCILFNPILNQGEYNTTYIEEYCKARGIRFFKYPWLQWGGYWPTPMKRTWGVNREWGLFHLKELAERCAQQFQFCSAEQQFDVYYESLFQGLNFRGLMEQEVEKTTRLLQQREQEGRVDFPISSFILENFRQKPLFLTPDHPSTELYKFVVRHVGSALNLRLDPSFEASRIEVQEGIRTPILPGVAEVLELRFQAADWGNHEFLGEGYYSLRDYARTTFPALPVHLATACNNTRIKSLDPIDASAVTVKTKLLIQLRNEPMLHDHMMVDVLGPQALRRTRALLYKSHWQLDAPSF